MKVTGIRVNRGAGYGVEVPYIYRLYGPEAYIVKRLYNHRWTMGYSSFVPVTLLTLVRQCYIPVILYIIMYVLSEISIRDLYGLEGA